MAAVRLLPEAATRQLRAGPVAVDVVQCVEELVLNAVDAGATHIRVEVDLAHYTITVDDDGGGLRHVDLEAAGRLHHTSKATTLADMHPGATFGFRGEALAALQEVGVLSLTARDPETSLTWTKVMHHGRTAALHAAAHSRPAGVSARIQDLFGTLPVRRKALQPAAVLQATRLRVVALALVRPDLAITLVDSSGGETLLQTPGQAADARAAFSRLFGVERARGLHRISTATTSHGLRLSGFISTATHWTPELQFLSINGRPIRESAIITALASCFGKSLLCSELHSEEATNDGSGSDVRPKRRKRMSRYAIYMLDLKVSQGTCDATTEPTKRSTVLDNELDAVALAVRAAEHFLRRHYLLPEQARTEDGAVGAEPRTPSPRRSSDSDGPATPPPSALSPELARELSALAHHSPPGKNRGSPGTLPRRLASSVALPSTPAMGGKGPVSSVLLRRHSLASATVDGCHTTDDDNSASATQSPRRHGVCHSAKTRYPARITRALRGVAARPFWLMDDSSGPDLVDGRDSLSTDALLASALQPSPTMGDDDDDELFDPAAMLARIKWRQDEPPPSADSMDTTCMPLAALLPTSSAVAGRLPLGNVRELKLNRDAVSRLQLLGQVDNKFLACLLPSDGPGGSMLVMVDQHAAHERVRLEMLEDTCLTVDDLGRRHILRARVVPPYRLVLGGEAIRKARTCAARMRDWGVELRVVDDESVDLYHLPAALVADENDVACVNRRGPFTTRPSVVADYVRQRLAVCAAGGGAGGSRWVIPAVLQDVLNTRACHGAIKFGDPLTPAQSMALLADLAACKLPFQCAHGRPSMAPLLDMGQIVTDS